MNTHDLTRDGIVSALTPKPGLLPQTKPTFLRDVLRMKRTRGDTDCEAFKFICRDFAYGLNATIAGAACVMRQLVAKRAAWVSDDKQARRVAFLADLDAVLSGEFEADIKVAGEIA